MTTEQLEATVPDEPPRGSVVVDKAGRAWQHLGGGMIFGDGGTPYLLAYAGPVTLVHRGTKDAP